MSFHSHLQQKIAEVTKMLKSGFTLRQIVFWFVYRSSGSLASRYSQWSGYPVCLSLRGGTVIKQGKSKMLKSSILRNHLYSSVFTAEEDMTWLSLAIFKLKHQYPGLWPLAFNRANTFVCFWAVRIQINVFSVMSQYNCNDANKYYPQLKHFSTHHLKVSTCL